MEEYDEDLSYEERFYRLKRQYDVCSDTLKKTERELKISLSSASYRLGHLLIHETKSVADLLKLFGRIRAIRNSRSGAEVVKNSFPASNTGTRKTPPKVEQSSSVEGVSVLLPTYKGEHTIRRALLSLAKQNLSRDLYEVIVVINGEEGRTGEIVDQFHQEFPDLNLHVVRSDERGASLARNLAVERASRQYTVLLDDDDALSATYLSAMYELASERSVVLSQIVDIECGIADSSNPINMQVLEADRFIENAFKACPGVLTINACKMVPTSCMKQLEFDTSLGSGEDVVFFSELFSRFNFRFKIAKEAVYFRYVERNSISRQSISYEFNVLERLKVISGVYQAMSQTGEEDILIFLKQKVAAQISFINTYLNEFPEDRARVFDEIYKYKFENFPFDRLNSV